MRTRSRIIGALLGSALIVSAATPAAARGWDWGGRGHRHHDDGAGAVIGALIGVGLIAAIASSASKKGDAEVERRYEPDPPYAGPDDHGYYDNGAPRPNDEDGARYDNRSNPPRNDDARAAPSAEDAAVDGCALAARDRAGEGSSYAEVRGITAVAPKGSGWDVTGTLEQRSSFRANDGWSRNFRCSWEDGRVSAVTLD